MRTSARSTVRSRSGFQGCEGTSRITSSRIPTGPTPALPPEYIRASVLPKTVELVDMKNGGMKNEIYEKMNDPKTTPEQKKEIQASIKDKYYSNKITLDPTTWHKCRVEVFGDEMLIIVDGTVAGYFKSEGVDHPAKNMIGLTIGTTAGKTSQVKDFKVWEATAAEGWDGKRAGVIASLKK